MGKEHRIISFLKSQVTTLQGENTALKAQIAAVDPATIKDAEDLADEATFNDDGSPKPQ